MIEFARSFSFSSLKVFRGWSLLGLISLISIYRTLSSSASTASTFDGAVCITEFPPFSFITTEATGPSLCDFFSLLLSRLFSFTLLLSALCLVLPLLLALLFELKRSLLLSPVTSSMMSRSFVSISSSSFCSKSSSSRGAASAKSASRPLPRPPFLLAIFLFSPLFSIQEL